MLARVSEQTAPSIPPGWYPDHANPALQRWWDGNQWTEHVQQSYVAGGMVPAQLQAPEGTNWNTPWIWLVIATPMLALLPIFFFSDISESSLRLGSGSFTPGGLANQLLSLAISTVIAGLVILFAVLDRRELVRRGVPAPFHWAFAFFALINLGVIYAIGRGVVTKRRTGHGSAVTWVAIISIVVSVIVFIVWVSITTAALFSSVYGPG